MVIVYKQHFTIPLASGIYHVGEKQKMGELNFTIYDNTKERTGFMVNTADLTSANIDSEYTEAIAFQALLDAVTLGNITKRTHTAKASTLGPVVRASDPQAQREAKAMMLFYDSVTFEPGRREIPCIDLDTFATGSPGIFYDSENAANATAAWQAFVTGFEAFEVGPGGNAVVVSQIYHIGKAN